MPVYFLDSSALVKRYVPEVGTSWVRGLTTPTASHTLIIAQVTPAEIVSGVERLQTLIDDLLLYSRAGRGQTERRPVDVGEVVRDVLWALGPQLRERDAEVSVAQLPTVMAERGMLRQIFQNLIANAIKFGDPGRPYVQIRAEREPGAWRFEIEDNGSGIEPRHADRVFEMFQRLHGREVPGSGIGLAIVKRLTERLGGRVAVGPAAPKGSIFTVTLPDRARPL